MPDCSVQMANGSNKHHIEKLPDGVSLKGHTAQTIRILERSEDHRLAVWYQGNQSGHFCGRILRAISIFLPHPNVKQISVYLQNPAQEACVLRNLPCYTANQHPPHLPLHPMVAISKPLPERPLLCRIVMSAQPYLMRTGLKVRNYSSHSREKPRMEMGRFVPSKSIGARASFWVGKKQCVPPEKYLIQILASI